MFVVLNERINFNFMIVFQAEHNILMHPFHMLGVAGVFDDRERFKNPIPDPFLGKQRLVFL
jgi:hypothetical protein